MFDTVRHRPSKRNLGRSAKLVLTVAAAFTLLAGGTALATTANSSGTDTHQVPAAQSLLHAADSGITEAEIDAADTDAADDAAEAAKDAAEAAKDAAEAAKDAAEAAREAAGQADDANTADGAQGVHGACVSKVARDTTIVGRAHGLAVSKAAHECPKGADTAAGAAKGAEKSAAAQARRAAKSAARTARGKG